MATELSVLRAAILIFLIFPSSLLFLSTAASKIWPVGRAERLSSQTLTPLESLLTGLQSAALRSFGQEGFDPKLYVDLPLKTPLAEAKAAFEALPQLSNGTIPSATLKDYIDKFYDAAGSDLLPYTPGDYKVEPDSFLPRVQSGDARAWALKIHALWLQLSRKVANDVLNNSDLHTLLPLTHPVIVPGSRFREVYYWDSYWIIRGLVVSKMFDTAKGIVQNLLSLVEAYGFVPNGARTYYTNRSQPPLLSEMVRVVYKSTSDLKFLKEAFHLLVREHRFWDSALHRVRIKDKKGQIHLLSRYSANWMEPRPESFTTDELIAQNLSEADRQSLYHEIASTAETGWDFSSRWMENTSTLSSLRTSLIVPVDLNAFLFQMATNIAYFARELGKEKSAKHFGDAAKARRLAVDSILWTSQAGQWLDFWIPSKNHTDESLRVSKELNHLGTEILLIWPKFSLSGKLYFTYYNFLRFRVIRIMSIILYCYCRESR
ncbi:hypothetical protein O6H91_05G029100 [Diphasiastrum complanatum]|uniref:Uncharacterized protein n=1 Tax=Diphasiastrum complanatum TaxID=34168 RepID=A0ACC2DME6_DIPCM|nr:hypothetical protein O6H91_05G029100 [Diphasiastrum complanatum]